MPCILASRGGANVANARALLPTARVSARAGWHDMNGVHILDEAYSLLQVLVNTWYSSHRKPWAAASRRDDHVWIASLGYLRPHAFFCRRRTTLCRRIVWRCFDRPQANSRGLHGGGNTAPCPSTWCQAAYGTPLHRTLERRSEALCSGSASQGAGGLKILDRCSRGRVA